VQEEGRRGRDKKKYKETEGQKYQSVLEGAEWSHLRSGRVILRKDSPALLDKSLDGPQRLTRCSGKAENFNFNREFNSNVSPSPRLYKPRSCHQFDVSNPNLRRQGNVWLLNSDTRFQILRY
jgi:hypothetical protein